MAHESIAVEGIVSCPTCGSRNRIGIYSATLRPVCGKCKTPLDAAININKPRQRSTYTPRHWYLRSLMKWKPSEYLPLVVVACLVVGAFVMHMFAPSPAQYRRLPHGTIIRCAALTGKNNLKVNNGLDKDSVAKLVNKVSNTCEAFFYIAAHSTFTLNGIPDGQYRLLFVTGLDWDDVVGFFTKNAACSEFNEPMDFVTTVGYEQRGEDTYRVYHYQSMEITLHPVPSGTARIHQVSVTDFQKY